MMKQKLKAFTLAEVLITLGIIGVVAALTIPSLLQNTQNKETITALKKSYSALSQAYLMAVQENGPTETWDIPTANDGPSAIKVMDIFSPYLRITKNCGNSGGCFASGGYKTVNNNNVPWDFSAGGNQFASAQLSDGSSLISWCGGAGTGFFIVDVNGYKKPNQYGKDTFWIGFDTKRVSPYGYDSTNCDSRASADSGDGNGRGCAAWILKTENLDYLKCPEILSWNGPTKCN